MRRESFVHIFFVYALLACGAVIFSWPFVWMTSTSVKIDREIFAEKLHMFPQRPIPALRSPYVDERYFADVDTRRLSALFSAVQQRLSEIDYAWPDDIDRQTAIEQCARGILKKLALTLPANLWQKPIDELCAAALAQINAALISDVFAQIRRALCFGELRIKSDNLAEELLVTTDAVASSWKVLDSAHATLVQTNAWGELHYDFANAQRVELSETFATQFPVARFYRILLSLRPDDSWHALTCYIEKLGTLYKAERAFDLADSRPSTIVWQEAGPDDRTNKQRMWITLREIDRGVQYETDPHKIRIRFVVERRSEAGAWWAKIRRNYRLTLDYIPFWRYVATSLFLIVLNLVGTLFSCSLVAYSFARLQWPGRDVCFALMLGTMMIPAQVTMIPQFFIMRSLGWYNTLFPLWVGSFFANAFNVFLLRQFLKGIPRDLEDAAKIDGCGF